MSLGHIWNETPPTAGFPLTLKDFFHFGKASDLQKEVSLYLQDQFARITCSGTAALYIILQTIKELKASKSEQYIIIPSYICPLVPLAIHRAGLKVLVCELEESQTSFNYNKEKLKALCQNQRAGTEIVAVIACHLAGVPLDMDGIEACTQNKNIFIIEDAAQALGASFKNQKPLGTRGDFAFFSLCRGKGPSMFEGGILTSKHKHFEQIIDAKIAEHIPPQHLTLIEIRRIIELLGYAVFYRPLFMWFVFKAPQLYWEKRGDKIKALGEDFDLNFPLHSVSNFRKYLALGPFRRLKSEVKKQREKALYLIQSIEQNPKLNQNIKIIKEHPGDESNYPYLSLVLKSSVLKQKILKASEKKGLGISEIYAYSLPDYAYLRDIIPPMPHQSKGLDKQLISLSTSSFADVGATLLFVESCII